MEEKKTSQEKQQNPKFAVLGGIVIIILFMILGLALPVVGIVGGLLGVWITTKKRTYKEQSQGQPVTALYKRPAVLVGVVVLIGWTVLSFAVQRDYQAQTAQQPQTNSVAETETKNTSAQVNPEPEPKPEAAPEPKPEPKPEATPELKPEPKPVPEATKPVLTTGQKNALSAAAEYLAFTAFSHSGLLEQLKFEGYADADAKYAADHCGADWNQQAIIKATEYLAFSSFSRAELLEQLKYEGFTAEQAEYGVAAVYD